MSDKHSNDNKDANGDELFTSYDKCSVVKLEQLKAIENVGSFEFKNALECLSNFDPDDLTQEEIDYIIHGIPTQEALSFLNGRISSLF